MDFSYTPEQDALRELARTILTDHVTHERLKALEAAGDWFDQKTWQELAQAKLLDGSGFKKLKEVIAAQGGNPQVLDRFDLLPNATGMREIVTPRGGYVAGIDAQLIGRAATLIGAGRATKEDAIDPAVGVILDVKVGQKVDGNSVLCRLYYRDDVNVEEAAELVEDAFRISTAAPEDRELILEVVS